MVCAGDGNVYFGKGDHFLKQNRSCVTFITNTNDCKLYFAANTNKITNYLSMKTHYQILIVGGGNAGISVAAQLNSITETK